MTDEQSKRSTVTSRSCVTSHLSESGLVVDKKDQERINGSATPTPPAVTAESSDAKPAVKNAGKKVGTHKEDEI